MKMARNTIIVGALLIGLGLLGYFVIATPGDDGRVSITTLIPLFFGVPIVLCGFAAVRPSWRKTATHVALLIALLGLLGALMRPIMVISRGDDLVINRPFTMQLIMAVLCVTLLVLGVRSFMAARRAPKKR